MPKDDLDALEISLKSTTLILQDLLNEVRNNATFLAVLKERIDELEHNTEDLSHILRGHNGNDSVVMRLAFAEKYLEDLKINIVDIQSSIQKLHVEYKEDKTAKEEHKESQKKFKRDLIIARYGIWAAAIPSIISFGIMIFQTFIK